MGNSPPTHFVVPFMGTRFQVARFTPVLPTAGLILSLLPATSPAQMPTCNGKEVTIVAASEGVTNGTDGDDVILGSTQSDEISAGAGNDTICALEGDDGISGGPGSDFIDGGEGTDWLNFPVDSEAGLVVDLSAGYATWKDETDEILLGTIENVTRPGCADSAADTLIGDGDDNLFWGGSGPDLLVGNAGDDQLFGSDNAPPSDAICVDRYEGDHDRLEGGEGDDVLAGESGDDRLDGGPGRDALSGGGEFDQCFNGETYGGCDQHDPRPPPACADGIDNDDDGDIDNGSDAECSADTDPTEDRGVDPPCDDGIDNDDDGSRDYPEDYGCWYRSDGTEYNYCPFLCYYPQIEIRYKSSVNSFRGDLFSDEEECNVGRRIILRRIERARRPIVGRTTTKSDRTWAITINDAEGRYRAEAHRRTIRFDGGETLKCWPTQSRAIRVP